MHALLLHLQICEHVLCEFPGLYSMAIACLIDELFWMCAKSTFCGGAAFRCDHDHIVAAKACLVPVLLTPAAT